MQAKPWYQSATYYALGVAIVTKILMMAGLAETEAGEQAGQVVTTLLPFVGICADLIAAWGRKRAQGPVTLTKAAAKDVNGFVRSPAIVGIFIAAIGVLMLYGCANQNPIRTSVSIIHQACAKDGSGYQVENCAGATVGVYEIWQRQGVAFVQNPATPIEVKRAIRTADAAATPVMLELIEATKTFAAIKAELAAAPDEERLLVATQNLERYVLLAVPKVEALITSLGG